MYRVIRGLLIGVEALLGGVLLGGALREGKSRLNGTGVPAGVALQRMTNARAVHGLLHAGVLHLQLRGPLLRGQSGCGDLRVTGTQRN